MSTETTGSTRVSNAVLDEIVQFIHNHDDPGVTVAEVASGIDALDRSQVKYRLKKLEAAGRVRKKVIGASAAIWFPVG